MSLWNLFNTAKTFQARPSDLLAIDDTLAAYCLDSACAEFGNALQGELNGIEGKNSKEVEMKSNRMIRRWLDLPLEFRDPANG